MTSRDKRLKRLDRQKAFGTAAGGLPSWFARIPTAAIMDQSLSHGEIRVLCCIAAYANNQGFAWPNQTTIREKIRCSKQTVLFAMGSLQAKGHIEIVSRHRSHPKWRRVMGNVYRIIFDESLATDKLIDAMNREDEESPITNAALKDMAGRQEADEGAESNQPTEIREMQLGEAGRAVQGYIVLARQSHGQIRLGSPRAIEAALRLIEAGMSVRQILASAERELAARRSKGRDAPHHLGDCGIDPSLVEE